VKQDTASAGVLLPGEKQVSLGLACAWHPTVLESHY
jgi:hypothetical protein